MTKRLSLAINLPSEIKAQLTDLVLKLYKANKNKSIKWVANENFHLTLHFLGDVPEEKISDINQTLEPIVNNFPTLNFSLSSSINAFPDLNNPKVIFLEMKELNDGKTIQLQREIGKSLSKMDFEIDYRPFKLHLTLGRVKFKTNIQIPRLGFAGRSRTNLQFPISNFHVNSIDLMESNLIPTGPIYTCLKQYKLIK
jgi:2'-5' RNA ligase